MGVQILKMKLLLILLVITLQLAVTANGLTCCELGKYGEESKTDGCEKTCETVLTPQQIKHNFKPVCTSVRLKIITNVSDINSPFEYTYQKLCNAHISTGRFFPYCRRDEFTASLEDEDTRGDRRCYCLTNLCNKNINYTDGSSIGAKNSGHGGGLTSVVAVAVAVAAAAVVTGLGRRHYDLIC